MQKQKNIQIFAALLLIGSVSLFGQQEEERHCPPEPCPKEKCPPCQPLNPCANCAQLWPARGPDWIITPNAGPCVSNGVDVFLTTEFIYWTARENHLSFATKEPIELTNVGTTVSEKGNVFHPDWNFEPGFKVGIGILYDHDGWDLYANYTWLRVCNTKEKVSAKENERLQFMNLDLLQLPNVQEIEGKWEHDFNVIDLELGRNFFISRYLKLRPHFGLKGTWQEQDFDIDGLNLSMSGIQIQTIRNKMDYWGIGIRAGLDSSWHFTRCFSLFGEIALSALWERFEVDHKRETFDQPSNTILVNRNLESNFHTIKPVLELFLGLRWETWFRCDAYHFSIEAGWEQQWWNDQNQFFAEFVESKEGDLILQGLTLKIRLDF